MFKKKLANIFNFHKSAHNLLLFAVIGALLISNSNFYRIYEDFFQNFSLKFTILNSSYNIDFIDFVNDFLMAIFFFLIGLELKKEILVGELSSKSRIMLPIITACGGVIVPALIFLIFNYNLANNVKGFAIPTATDIAFSYAIVKMFEKKISSSLKIFLISLAVVDDIIAIVIIAIFYSQNLQILFIFLSLLILLLLAFLNYKKHYNLATYLLLGFLLWITVLKSGIHPTIAGILLAMFIPFKTTKNQYPLEIIAKKISPIVNFIILPIFAFCNSGVRIIDLSYEILFDNLILGIVFGLFIGKPLGIITAALIANKLNLAHLPKNSSLKQFYAISILTGIGFTMSLFIGHLAFQNNIELMNKVKIAVLLGSSLSAIIGMIVIRRG